LNRRHIFEGREVEVVKRLTFRAGPAGIKASYSVDIAPGAVFGVELNINLLAAHDEDRYYEIPGLSREMSYLDCTGVSRSLRSFALTDRYSGLRISMESSRAFDLLRYPVYTVSQSDRGFEKNYQGSSLILAYTAGKGRLEFEIALSVD
jgi:hypothetical protein